MTEQIDWSAFDAKEGKFIKVTAGITKTMKFSAVKQEFVEMTDKVTNQKKQVPALVFSVIGEDGKPCDKQFTATSKKLIAKLKPFIDNGEYKVKTIEFNKFGSGYAVDYNVRAI